MLLLDRKHLHLAMNKICKFYQSNIIGMHFGETPVIVLNDSDKVKKALNHRDFDGKPDILMGRMRDPNLDLFGLLCISKLKKMFFIQRTLIFLGIFFTDGQKWFEQRRFTLRYLRDFGFGRRFDSLEQEIHVQLGQYIDMIKNGAKYPHEMVNWIE